MANVSTVAEAVARLYARAVLVLRWEKEERPCRALLYTRTKRSSRRDEFLHHADKRLGSSVQIKLFGGAAKGRPTWRNDLRIEEEVEGGQVDVVLLEDLDVTCTGDPEGFWIFLRTLHDNGTHLLSLDGQFDSMADPLAWDDIGNWVVQGDWQDDWDELPEPLRSRVQHWDADSE